VKSQEVKRKRGWDDGDYYGYGYEGSYYKKTSYVETSKKFYFYDEEFHHSSSFVIDKKKNEVSSINFSKERIQHEECLIFDFLNQLDSFSYEDMFWDGVKLTVRYTDKEPTMVYRSELVEYIDELSLSKYISKCNSVTSYDDDDYDSDYSMDDRFFRRVIH